MKQPELGLKILELRENMGLTQDDFVWKCNISLRTLQRIESGGVNPRNFTNKTIFRALDYDMRYESDNQKHQLSGNQKFSLDILYDQLKNYEIMKNLKSFLFDFFLSTGIVWFFCALSLMIFNLNFQMKEILLTLIIPLSFAIFRFIGKYESSKSADKKIEWNKRMLLIQASHIRCLASTARNFLSLYSMK